MTPVERVYIGIGSNLGDREAKIRFGIERLRELSVAGRVEVSGMYESEAWGGVTTLPFINCVVSFETELEPFALLRQLKRIEQEAGRIEGGEHWAARELDLDILLYGEQSVESEDLTIPHRYLTQRRFVLKPLSDLVPDLVIPGVEQCVAEALRAVKDSCWVRPLNEGIKR